MTKKQAISPTQLFSMMILFEFGTALVLPIGLGSGANAWLSILLAMPGAMILYVLFTYFEKQFPSMILSGYTQKIIGVYLGWPVSFLYILFFIYISARNLREAGDLLISASYDQTPIAVVQAIMITAVIYVLCKGINAFFRLGEIYFLIIVSIGILSHAAILASGTLDLRNLLPVMGKGWMTTLKNAYPNIFMFPFGELVCFTTVLPYLKQKQLSKKTGLLAILASSLMLSLTHAMEVAVVGGDVYSRATFPLFTVITIVDVAEFMQRLDSFVILALIIGVFFKMTVYAFAAASVANDLFRFKEHSLIAYPVGIIIFLVSIILAWSVPEHNAEGFTVLYVVLPVFCLIIPVLLFIVHLFRKRFGHST
ncbi:spore germination protein [Paenibacillus sp. N4]|uniref:GerAB/ArcD/ProY family transporter n=1 Tax=Paenibacillus vietnamensis TaxID=2590547 RepID=UPI001CD0ACF2|nr:GerAB/ArcD/ProY family transporter [Paenibacillus vietnamensis]MCA0758490.1 spore germination protein [Paenibacillus vietnamensis]